MATFSQRIVDLENKLKDFKTRLETIIKESLKLESKNHQELQQKEKELEEWRQKLEVLQQERNQIKQEIKDKVSELEQSQLSNSEKQAQINRLLTEHSQELEELDKLLYDERTNYRNIRDKLINKLCEPCSNCQTQTQAIKTKDKKIFYLLGIIGLMLVLFFLFHVWFLAVAIPKYIKKRLKERSKFLKT